jgi:charged multivesicular body protein 4
LKKIVFFWYMKDELEAELEDLAEAELEEQLLQQPTASLAPTKLPSMSTVPSRQPSSMQSKPQSHRRNEEEEEEEELAALQAEMAL